MKIYGAISITGTSPSMKEIDGSILADQDMCFTLHNGKVVPYLLDIDSGLPESSPAVIAPTNNAGNKRWLSQSDSFGGSILDEGTFTLPTITNGGWGRVIVGSDEERSDFSIASDGTVNLIHASSNVVANADTDGKVCIGTSVANPCIIKNRLGSTKVITVHFWFS
jgi:hypothetical protein